MKKKPIPFSVLIVDDDEDLCLILRASLKCKFPVTVVHTLAEAVLHLSRNDISLLLLDNSLPDGKGVDWITAIKSRHPDTKIIMMTADNSPVVKEAAIREGVSAFIAKPFKSSFLKEAIGSLFPTLSPL